jgi:hypothetical protein
MCLLPRLGERPADVFVVGYYRYSVVTESAAHRPNGAAPGPGGPALSAWFHEIAASLSVQ